MERLDLAEIGIIIPALNEAATIAAVVSRVAEYGTPIVVDDGSSDATAELALAAGAQLVKHAVNRGYDGALSSGFARAQELGCTYAITIDADGQHNPQQLEQYIRLLREGNALVLGVRDRHQRISEEIFSKAGKFFWQIADPLCGMKGYHMRLYRALGHFDSFRSIGTELAVRAVASKVVWVQTQVITRDRLDAPRFARQFSANVKILRALLILLMLHALGKLAIRQMKEGS